MKVVCQRVLNASVTINNKIYSSIDKGILILVGFKNNDTLEDVKYMAKKVVNLRIFDDRDGVMNESLLDQDKEILSVSQFTLYANALKGNRPSYIEAMRQDDAKILYEAFNEELKKYTNKVKTGIFREDMKVSLINDGPITIIIEK